MSNESEWSVEFYISENGESPVRDFLASLNAKTQIRFAWFIEQLRLRNTQACPSLGRHIEGKLWELREESASNIYRVLYVFFTGQRIVFLHRFQKKR